MGWEDLLQVAHATITAPWIGGKRIHNADGEWRINGDRPASHGWYKFELNGRNAKVVGTSDASLWKPRGTVSLGYAIGNRLVPLDIKARTSNLTTLMHTIHLIEPGLDRFTVVQTIKDPIGRRVYLDQCLPLGPEDEVRKAFIDKIDDISHIKDVTPALEIAFTFAIEHRKLVEKRRAEAQKAREAAQRREEALRSLDTGVGRRHAATMDFNTAAEAALRISGAKLLDAIPGQNIGEMRVRYLFDGRRLECVVDKYTLRIIDSGICLTNEYTGEKHDTSFTLESLPAVVRYADRQGRLVIYRYA